MYTLYLTSCRKTFCVVSGNLQSRNVSNLFWLIVTSFKNDLRFPSSSTDVTIKNVLISLPPKISSTGYVLRNVLKSTRRIFEETEFASGISNSFVWLNFTMLSQPFTCVSSSLLEIWVALSVGKIINVLVLKNSASVSGLSKWN